MGKVNQRWRRVATAAIVTASALSLASCTPFERPEIATVLNVGAEGTLAIAVDPASPEQLVIGEIYNQVLAAYGRPVGLAANSSFASRSPLDILKEDNVDIVVGCTGQVLTQLDPQTAASFAQPSDEAAGAADENTTSSASEAERQDEVYAAMVATFPANVRSVDPSPAQACQDSEAAKQGLPENIVPIIKDGELTRTESTRLNFITRVMSTKDIEEMTERVEAGETVRSAVAEWLMEYASININAPKTKDEDEKDGTQRAA